MTASRNERDRQVVAHLTAPDRIPFPRRSPAMPESTCTINDCGRPIRARGYCNMHYLRLRAHGDPLVTTRLPTRPWNPIACAADGCEKLAECNGYCGMHRMRVKAHGDPSVVLRNRRSGSEHHNWAGDDVTYAGAHMRVRTARGPAGVHICVCGQSAAEWAYDHTDPDERTGDVGGGTIAAYSTDVTHYAPMCVPCHRKFDNERTSLTTGG